jgi:poly(A) polymerase
MSQTDTKKALAVEIVRRLQERGYTALLAGGCVRDMVMGTASADYDIATSARPEEVVRLFEKTVPVGAQFGVIMVLKEGHPFEVATFRSEGPYSDGRHPDDVSFCDPEKDAHRRDFTINGMFYDPIKEKLLDYVGGQQDIKARLLRTIGEPHERFKEDRLRMVRAVRFASRFEYEIEEATRKAIQELAPKILTVSWERIREELEKILLHRNRSTGIKLLDELGLLEHILPEITRMKGITQPDNLHPEGDVFIHSLLTISHLEDPSWVLAMGSLLHDVAKPVTWELRDGRIRFPYHESIGAEMAERICDRLRTSREEKERISWLVRKHMTFKDARKMKLSTLKRLLSHPDYPLLAEVCRVDALASSGDLSDYNYCEEMRGKFKEEEIKPQRLISGHDLIALGLKPSPLFSEILNRLYDEQLEGKLHTREEALTRARAFVTELQGTNLKH